MRVFITGGCGFIGSHMSEFHLAKGDEVHVIDNLSTGTLENIAHFKDNPRFKCDIVNMLSWPDLRKAVEWADRIYHFVATVGLFNAISNPLSIIENNILSYRLLFQTISESNARPLVMTISSSSVYGDNPNHLLNENDDLIIKSPLHPLSTYSISKLADESIALAYHKMAAIPIIIIRPFNTVGPRQTGKYGMVVPRFVKQAKMHEPLTIFGDGTQTRSFCDVRDSVIAFDLLANQPESIGQIINVGNDKEISINDLANLVSDCIGRKCDFKYIPYNEAYGTEFTDITQRRPDISKLKRLVPFKHQWTISQTINDLIAN